MDNGITNLIRTNPKVKYALIGIGLPVMIIVTLLQGGSLSDLFSPGVSSQELRTLVHDEINAHKIKYHELGTVNTSDINCNGKLKNSYGATQICTIDARNGKIEATVKVEREKTNTSAMQISINNIR